MLVQPASSGQEAFVGIGDLDELDGKVRIRELPGTSSNDAVSKYYGGVQHGGHRDERGARRGDMGADLVHRACIGLRVDLSSRRVSPTGTSGSSRTLRHDFSTTTFTPLDFHYIRSIMNAQFHSASLLGLRVAPTGRQVVFKPYKVVAFAVAVRLRRIRFQQPSMRSAMEAAPPFFE